MVSFSTWILTFLQSVFAFVAILVPLVVFHEFGHFLFARLFGVKAEIFSVGFGPRLFGKVIGETEWRLSAIPLGGYVKLLGEEQGVEIAPEDQKKALNRQAPWKRFLIFFGGPLFNFLLAIFIFMVIFTLGEPQMASVVGRVVRHSAAEKVGFQSGDKVLSVQGKPVKRFEDILEVLNANPGKTLDFEVLHPDQTAAVHLSVPTSTQAGYSAYGESIDVGEVEGLLPVPRSNQVGVSNLESKTGQFGIVTGDQVIAVNDQPVTTWEKLESIYSHLPPGAPLSLKFRKKADSSEKVALWVKPSSTFPREGNLGEDFGLHSSEMFVEKAMPKSPAAEAGIQSGDRLIKIGQFEVQSFFDLKDAVQKSGEKDGKIQIQWERAGRVYTTAVVPTATAGRDVLLKEVTRYTVGVVPMLVMAEPITFVERVFNPFKLVYLATERVVSLSWKNLVSLRKILFGEVSMGTLGGPIMIGKIAGESMARGLIVFLTNMAIFSIGLGVLNILPVPVLDGGHLLLLGVESVRGKPLTPRQMEIVQSIGLVFILALMVVAFKNDLARLFFS